MFEYKKHTLIVMMSSVLAFFIILSANASAADKVSIQLRWDHQFQFAGYYAAKWNGYYAEAGFDVDIRSAVKSDGKILSTVEEVASGNADFGVGAADILIARDRGIPLVVLVSVFKQSAAEFYAKAETPFSSPSDLIHLRVARIVDDLIDIELQAMLLAEGIDPKKIKPYPHQPGIEHLVKGQADVIPGYRISLPYELAQQGIRVKILRPVNYGVDFYGDSLFTHERVIESNPDGAERFVHATEKGWLYAMEHPAEIAERISRNLPRTAKIAGVLSFPDSGLETRREFNRFQIDGVKELTQYPIADIGHINPHRWQRMHHFMQQIGVVKNPLDVDKFIFAPEKLKIQREQRLRRILIIILCATAGIVVFIGVWIIMLRMVVARKTRELQQISKGFQQSTAELEMINQQLNDEIEERRQMEEELKKYKQIVSCTPDGVSLLDKDYRYRIINDAYETFSGKKREQFIGLTIAEYLGEEIFNEHIKAHFDRCLNGETIRFQDWFQYPTLGRRFVHVTYFPYTDTNNQIAGIVASTRDITELRLAEEALHKSEQQYRHIVENQTELVSRFTPDGTFIFVNDAYCHFFKKSKSDLIGKKWFPVAATEDISNIKEKLMLLSPSNPTVVIENRVISGKGDIRWMQFVNHGFFDEKGSLLETQSVGRDINDQRLAEEALKEQRKFLESIYNGTELGIFVIDVTPDNDFRYVGLNPSHARLTGLSVSDIQGRTPEELVPLISYETASAIRLNYARCLQNGHTIEYEEKFISHGNEGWWLTRLTPLKNNNEQIYRLIGTSIHITDRKQAEEKIQFQALLLDSVEQSVIATNMEGTIIYLNKFAESLYGWSAEEAVGQNIIDLTVHQVNIEQAQEILSALMQGKSWHGELLVQRKDGSTFPAIVTSSPVYDDTGKMIAIVGISSDITDRKRAEEALYKAKEAAEAATRAKSEFLANMSHEIRTPISGIIGAIDMTLTYDMEANAKQNLKMMKNAATSLLNIINDVLDISKIEAGKMELVSADFDLYYAMEEIRSFFGVEAKKKNLFLQLHISSDVPRYLHGDENRLKQVIVNLVGNAIKFTKQGMISVTVEKTDDPYKLLFSIKDTGIGIPENKFSDVFKSFAQLDSTYSKKYQGTGLGLPISKRLIEMLGGSIWFESTLDKGTTFYFTTVFKKAALDEISFVSQSESGDEKEKFVPNFQSGDEKKSDVSLKILVAEDDALNRMSVVYLLEAAGHQVIAVSDGMQAVEAFKNEQVDLILMDIQMPETDGIEAAQLIRKHQEQLKEKPVPIIALTAYAVKGERERFMNAGMNDYLPKPVDKGKLFYAISSLISNRSQQTDLIQSLPHQPDTENYITEIKRYVEQNQDDKEFLNTMIRDFIRESPVRMDKLTQAITENDFERIAEAAHSTTNLASVIRGYTAVNYSAELERAAKNNNLQEILSSYELLKQEMDKILKYLDSFQVK